MSSVAVRPNVTGTVEQVMSGELFAGILLDDTDQRALALEAVLGKVVDDDTRVVWVGNPLRAPLTIERFLIQIVGPEVDLREERGPAELARLIAQPVGRASRLLVVVQQPETIDAVTREMLTALGGPLGGEAVQVQFLFAGLSSFELPQLVRPEIGGFAARIEQSDIHATGSEPSLPTTRRRDIAPLVLLLLSLTIGVVISIAPSSHDSVPTVRAAASTPAPAPPVTDISLLRRQFAEFLDQRTPTRPPMSDSEKDALFNAFLTYHRRE